MKIFGKLSQISGLLPIIKFYSDPEKRIPQRFAGPRSTHMHSPSNISLDQQIAIDIFANFQIVDGDAPRKFVN